MQHKHTKVLLAVAAVLLAGGVGLLAQGPPMRGQGPRHPGMERFGGEPGSSEGSQACSEEGRAGSAAAPGC